jgi:hypothetical protein
MGRKKWYLAGFLVLAAASVGSAVAQEKSLAKPKTASIEETLSTFLTAFNNLDWQAFRACFSGTATIFLSMNSCAASCCTCFPKVLCAFETSDSSPTAAAPRSYHFAFICSAQHRRQSKTYPAAKTQVIFGSAQNVVDRCRSSKGLLLSRSNSVLHLPWSRLPHETSLYSTNPLRA